MPKGTRVAKCVKDVKKSGSSVNPYAVCTAATGQSYATGKTTTKSGRPVVKRGRKG